MMYRPHTPGFIKPKIAVRYFNGLAKNLVLTDRMLLFERSGLWLSMGLTKARLCYVPATNGCARNR